MSENKELWEEVKLRMKYTHANMHACNIYVQTCLYSPKSKGDFFQLSLVLWLSILCRFHLVLLNIMGYLVFLVWRLTKHA